MNSSTDIAKQCDLQAASFNGSSKGTLQCQLIVSLLVKSVDSKSQITLNDILETYLDWKEQSGRTFTKEVYIGSDEYGHGQYKTGTVTRDEYKDLYMTKIKARQWFRSNLGSAIIQGKILAIPVINI